MINNLYDLNDTINAVVNRALDIVAEHSTSGQRYVDHSDVADLISYEDFHKYIDLISHEMSSREEVLEPVSIDGGQLDVNLGLAYCKAYEWCDGDEEIFGCSFEEWLKREAEPISHPLSVSRMAEIGHAAVAHILESSDMAIEDLTECVGMSLNEVNEITGTDLSDTLHADQQPRRMAEAQGSKPFSQHMPVFFYVDSASLDLPEKFTDFDAAFAMYKGLASNVEKNISFTTYDEQGRGHGALLLMSSGKGRDQPCNLGREALDNPHIALAHAKSVISCYPFDEAAWKLRDEAEAKLGITDRLVDTSMDLITGKWRTHVVPIGGHYGLHNHLINKKKPMVEFYDMSQSKETFPQGQFAMRYDVDTILGNNPYIKRDICLDLSCPEWTISADDLMQIVSYLKTFDHTGHIRSSLNDKISQAQSQRSATTPDRHTSAPER